VSISNVDQQQNQVKRLSRATRRSDEATRANSEGRVGGSHHQHQISHLQKSVRETSISSNNNLSKPQVVHRGTLRQLQELMTQMQASSYDAQLKTQPTVIEQRAQAKFLTIS
jgi:hypothetical protein